MRDLLRQGHITFDLNFPITGPNEARSIDFSLFLRFFGSGIEVKKINIVIFMRDLVPRSMSPDF